MRLLISVFFVIIINGFVNAQSVKLSSKRNKDNSVEINYEKDLFGSFYVITKFNKLTNSLDGEIAKVVKGKRGRLACLKPMDSQKGINYSYTYRSIRGNPNARIDKDFTYILPFEKNTEVYVKRLNNLGTHFNEKEPKNWTAYQFYSKGEIPVVAARKGLVVRIVDGIKSDTTQSYSFKSSKNEILIEHKDGTFARYNALKAGSICVCEGQTVNPGDKIGLTGRYDKKNKYQVRFMIYYLDKKLLFNMSEMKHKSLNSYLKPLFLTSKGIVFLEMKQKYTARCTDDLIMKEFSRREKKKYLKGELK